MSTKLVMGHKRDEAASQALAGDAEAGGRCSVIEAGRIGVDGGSAVRRERQSGLQLAQALS